MKFLVTGFTPFGGETVNPSYEAVKLLPDCIEGVELIKLELPTVYFKALDVMANAIEIYEPIGILATGQAGGRCDMTVERIGINLCEAKLPDNEGLHLEKTPIEAGGPDGIFTTLPLYEIVEEMRQQGIPCSISNSAGAYLCNNVLYGTLRHLQKTNRNVPAGFIHVPFMTEQALERTVASMPLSMIAKGLESAIQTTLKFCK